MGEKAERLKQRTHEFFVRVLRLCENLPDRPGPSSIAKQLADSAGATDSNYRAACRARSKKEFISKLGIAIEEADESLGWLRALLSARFADAAEIVGLIKEADELTRILVASKKTAELNLARANREQQKMRNRRNQTSSEPI